eukprot:6179045-Pleurochrysis_carterae.AAC.4
MQAHMRSISCARQLCANRVIQTLSNHNGSTTHAMYVKTVPPFFSHALTLRISNTGAAHGYAPTYGLMHDGRARAPQAREAVYGGACKLRGRARFC